MLLDTCYAEDAATPLLLRHAVDAPLIFAIILQRDHTRHHRIVNICLRYIQLWRAL